MTDRNKVIFWILAAIFAVGAIIDIADGYWPKTVSSLALTIAFIILAIAYGKSGKTKLYVLAYFFIFVALGAFLFRLVNYYS
ncbi:MAG: hypothetical protein R3345_05170 [Fulvivirga sp.]|nr:hypothetical protein [Fulvivirga sp.]